jgi:hypothetical protein
VSAIECIVNAYVRLGNRVALVDLLAHRERLLIDMNGRTGFDFSLPLGQIKEEIAVVLAGLDKLRLAGAALQKPVAPVKPNQPNSIALSDSNKPMPQKMTMPESN